MYEKTNKNHLIAILKVLLNIDDIQVMKYTIESLVEELEDSDNDPSTRINTLDPLHKI